MTSNCRPQWLSHFLVQFVKSVQTCSLHFWASLTAKWLAFFYWSWADIVSNCNPLSLGSSKFNHLWFMLTTGNCFVQRTQDSSSSWARIALVPVQSAWLCNDRLSSSWTQADPCFCRTTLHLHLMYSQYTTIWDRVTDVLHIDTCQMWEHSVQTVYSVRTAVLQAQGQDLHLHAIYRQCKRNGQGQHHSDQYAGANEQVSGLQRMQASKQNLTLFSVSTKTICSLHLNWL